MENTLTSQAVSLALSGDWQKASKINLQILSDNPTDLDALNRLARCYSELGQMSRAISTSQKVLKIDSENTIAQKCLEKWKKVKHKKILTKEQRPLESFLEESGKTKIVRLLNPGDSNIFANFNSGDEVNLLAYAHKVSVTSVGGKYIGRLPDDVAARLRNLLKNGVKYQTLIKSIDSQNISVFIRELENKTGLTSFPPEKMNYVTFAPPELVHRDLPEVANVDEVQE